MKKLDLTKLKTVKDIDNVNWLDYALEPYKEDDGLWIKFIQYPIPDHEVHRVCSLSRQSSKVSLNHHMGDIYATFSQRRIYNES